MIKQNSKTFYKAFSLLPLRKKQSVWAVYAFCRTVDDIVDEGDSPAAELAAFEQEFHLFLSGTRPSGRFLWEALEDTFSRFEMDVQAFRDMIEGQRMDLTKNRYSTVDEVLSYSYHVAGTVGLMLLPILAPKKTGVLRNSALSLGLAMQLTNILRDIGEDLDRNRIYLPKDVMNQFSCSEDDLKSGIVTEAFISVWEYMAFEAEAYYEEAMDTLHEYPLHSRKPVQAAAHFYKAILNKIRQNQYQVFSKRNFVTQDEKLSILSQLEESAL
ncbi:squalene/phytoene synthase family protein [Metabacillus sp. GX 13764]|uniref:phytoene/squalene synthase family protein n=1 Tax=Metabacillus kandeliae TaxID=2900151 RepID=UPI001E41E233|nr:phytoene/squalene synthase family protein [Metabacillus kandeliae]MCD7034913.1 squalene/phytoene synthase family protein [Metabacillus kandeliae]